MGVSSSNQSNSTEKESLKYLHESQISMRAVQNQSPLNAYATEENINSFVRFFP